MFGCCAGGAEPYIRGVLDVVKIPVPSRDSAVFLDIDGTLLDLAPTPMAVRVPPGLSDLLRGIAARQEGAFGLISGRSITDIDHIFGPGFLLAAEHGAVLRDAAGHVFESRERPEALGRIAAELRQAVEDWPGSLVEEKKFGVVVHWRAAPEAASALGRLAAELAAAQPGLVLQPAHEAVEIRAAGADKGRALATVMTQAPFAGRRPIFVGDDVTDEPAIETARRMGGIGLHVARDFGGRTQAVRDWLRRTLEDDDV